MIDPGLIRTTNIASGFFGDYHPLQAGQIRLLAISDEQGYSNRATKRLRPLGRLDDFHLSIIQTDLHRAPKYAAISYVWGDSTQLIPLRVSNGGQQRWMTRSSVSILRRIAPRCGKELPRFLWIDAICINQNDLSERSQQVRMMSDIYHIAALVIVDLGEADEFSDDSFDYLQRLAQPRKEPNQLGDNSLDIFWRLARPKEDDTTEPLPGVTGHIGLKHLLGRPWFSRVWVLQEIFSASRGEVWCGTKQISWHKFKEGMVECLEKQRWSQLSGVPFALLIQDRTWSARTDLLPLLHLARYCRCTDEKDKYFALLSMLDGATPAAFAARLGYQNGATEIFTAISTDHILQRGLDLVAYKEGRITSPGLPSWVVDWSIKPSNSALSRIMLDRIMQEGKDSDLTVVEDLYTCGGEFSFTPATILQGDNRALPILQVHGLRQGTVVWLSERMNTAKAKFHQTRAYFTDFQNKLPQLPRHGPSGTEQCRTDTLLRLFTGYWHHTPANYKWIRERTAMLGISTVVGTTKTILDSLVGFYAFPGALGLGKRNCPQIQIDTKLAVHDRRLALTDSGLLGLVPAETRRGDSIVVILDCPMPAILRPTGRNTFHLVGCGLVDGIMHGEALRDIKHTYPRYNKKPRDRPWRPPDGVETFILE